ncbi:DNA alkylation repair protein [Chryseobacterium sp. MP_3.2]|uniref:DNA alkylation repair protein n=1 Tax=Chryseobacterium sp. MP_3.2 TaxID=3071712 RepID=UPI002E02E951|nr:3-methyladenine DNA glycosylase AlkD [Chryseobacterium sp. MP_3.2]
MITSEIKNALQDLSSPEKGEFLPRFFKTGQGEYAEGDQFIGVSVPDQRIVAKGFCSKINLKQLGELLSSAIHEHRLCALLMLVFKFEKAKDISEKQEIVNFYLKNIKHINNWDLVDTSCYKILGRYYFEIEDDTVLKNLSEKNHLWSQRIAIVSTMLHVKKGSFTLMKALVLTNLNHPHDLMQKANGWLLREMGKKKESELLSFLVVNYQRMPRTTLRYAIEKLDENTRQDFLQGRL